MKNTCLFASVGLSLLAAFTLSAQQAEERQADFLLRQQGAQVWLQPVLPPLMQIAGAPQAFYEHYWEFGDGHFSFEEKPVYVYADTGTHEVFYLATGKYDNGKAPKSRKKKTEPTKDPPPRAVAQASPPVLPRPAASIGLRAVRNPRAGEEFVAILAYANPHPQPQSGQLYFFFNQRDYRHEHFHFREARAHYGEIETPAALAWAGPPFQYEGWAGPSGSVGWHQTSLPAAGPDETLAELRRTYQTARSWRYEGLLSGEQRHLFLSLDASSQMLADTNAIITLTALLVSDDQRTVERYDLEIEILASHDPNYLAVSRRRANFRGIRYRSLVYKAHFQNTGEGPASRVEITCDVPLGLDAAKVQVLEAHPACPLCPEGETEWSCLDTAYREGKLVFTFHNIYLPGTRQEGVRDRDSTKGYVKYRLWPSRDLRKLPMSPRASIVFDKNPPIVTRRAPTHFKPGLSPGLHSGWYFFPQEQQPNHFALGLSLAPFKPYRAYLQWELWAGLPGQAIRSIDREQETIRWLDVFEVPSPFEAIIDSVTTRVVERIEEPLYFQLVPFHLRKNASDWLGFGGGLLLNLAYRRVETIETLTTERIVYRFPDETMPLPDFYLRQEMTSRSQSQNWTAQAAAFADVRLGRVRQGAALGLRALLPLERRPAPYFLVYLGWRL
jgi:hypothetical protein